MHVSESFKSLKISLEKRYTYLIYSPIAEYESDHSTCSSMMVIGSSKKQINTKQTNKNQNPNFDR